MKLNSNVFVLLAITMSWSLLSSAQDKTLLTEKPGKFIILNHLNKCPGIDINTFSKNLTTIAEWIRQNNPVFNPPVGYDASISLSGNSCDKITDKRDFGLQCRINFSFHYFYIENGKFLTATDWAAHDTEISINNPITQISHQFDEAGFKTDDPPNLKQPLEKARENLHKYYTTAPEIKEIAPGVRLYAEGGWFKGVLLVFNPDRPDIWIPVTVKEIMEAKLAYYKVKQEIDSIKFEKALVEWAKLNFKPDQVMRPNIYDIIRKEFENFTADELDLPAYSSPQSGISTINARGEGRAVVRFNPASWDRTLPLTAVQFMSLEYRPATKVQLEEFKQSNQGLTDYVGYFFNNLTVEKMGVLIQKKVN
jgi:hypothetical protein